MDTVTVTVPTTVAAYSGELTCELSYTPSEPYAVTLLFDVGDHGLCLWTVARELLAAGLIKRSGIGDIAVAPAGEHVEITLFPREEHHTEFLNATYSLVPEGFETFYVPVDSWIDGLLGGAS